MLATWQVGGVLVAVVVACGQSMSDRTAKQIQAQDDATRAYIRDAAGSSSVTITDAEFATLKARALS